MKKLALAVALVVLTGLGFAQAGYNDIYASDFNYGASYPGLTISSGNTATGSQTVTVYYGNVTNNKGVTFAPLSTAAAVTVGTGAVQETVTPSAVSCSSPGILNTCTFTATFSYAHGQGSMVVSGSNGVSDAIVWAGLHGGGLVKYAASELVTLATGGATTDTTANLLYAGLQITNVAGVVSTAITGGTCSSWSVGDASTAARFIAADSTLTAGEAKASTGTAWTTGIASATTGLKQGSAAKVRITCGTGAPAAGKVRVYVEGLIPVAPAS